MTTPSIIECLDDPALFAGHFKGGTWGPWRTVLKALFSLLLDEAETALYRTHTGRTEAPAEPFKEAALVVGRPFSNINITLTVGVGLGEVGGTPLSNGDLAEGGPASGAWLPYNQAITELTTHTTNQLI